MVFQVEELIKLLFQPYHLHNMADKMTAKA